jgi:hypothetical protein
LSFGCLSGNVGGEEKNNKPIPSLPLAGVKFVPHVTPAFSNFKTNYSLIHRYSEDSPHRDKTSRVYKRAAVFVFLLARP